MSSKQASNSSPKPTEFDFSMHLGSICEDFQKRKEKEPLKESQSDFTKLSLINSTNLNQGNKSLGFQPIAPHSIMVLSGDTSTAKKRLSARFNPIKPHDTLKRSTYLSQLRGVGPIPPQMKSPRLEPPGSYLGKRSGDDFMAPNSAFKSELNGAVYSRVFPVAEGELLQIFIFYFYFELPSSSYSREFVIC